MSSKFSFHEISNRLLNPSRLFVEAFAWDQKHTVYMSSRCTPGGGAVAVRWEVEEWSMVVSSLEATMDL